ncbi:MAG: ATP-dependent Zn protease [Cyanobacteria bacterium P01_A01_bin.135]
MSQTTLNITAIAIFTITMTSLVGPMVGLSPAVPALIAAAMLAAATVDRFGWEGKGGTLFIDWFAQFSPEHRQRVLHHEAGHFLVAHLMGIPVTGYTLNAWDAFRQGQGGRGGVAFATQEVEGYLQRGNLPVSVVERYNAVWMAGIAAEQLVYGNAQGGGDDCQNVRQLWQQLGQPGDAETRIRWGALKAKTLIETHRVAYDALVQAMDQAEPLERCLAIVSTTDTANPV